VIFYAVVSDEIEQVIDFYATPSEAEAMLERACSGMNRTGAMFCTSSPSSS